eukprot:scaffold5380_cov228-Pinguiococcus_pyrenoidosus.AAC.1
MQRVERARSRYRKQRGKSRSPKRRVEAIQEGGAPKRSGRKGLLPPEYCDHVYNWIRALRAFHVKVHKYMVIEFVRQLCLAEGYSTSGPRKSSCGAYESETTSGRMIRRILKTEYSPHTLDAVARWTAWIGHVLTSPGIQPIGRRASVSLSKTFRTDQSSAPAVKGPRLRVHADEILFLQLRRAAQATRRAGAPRRGTGQVGRSTGSSVRGTGAQEIRSEKETDQCALLCSFGRRSHVYLLLQRGLLVLLRGASRMQPMPRARRERLHWCLWEP